MSQIPIPFTGEDVSTSNPTSMIVTIAMIMVGFVIFAFARMVGQTGAQTLSNAVAQTTGVNPSGEDSGENSPGMV